LNKVIINDGHIAGQSSCRRDFGSGAVAMAGFWLKAEFASAAENEKADIVAEPDQCPLSTVLSD
jgi:hypothetical protein